MHREYRYRRAGHDPLGRQEPRRCRRGRRPGRLRRGAGRARPPWRQRPRSPCAKGSRPRPLPAPPPMTPRSPTGSPASSASGAPAYRTFGGRLVEALRYGENPHQSAAFYRTPRCALRRRHGAAGAGQAALLQQHQRHRRRLRMRRRVRSRRAPPPAPSSSTPIRAASPRAKASATPTARRSPAIRSRPLAALSRSTARSMRTRRAPSPKSSPK